MTDYSKAVIYSITCKDKNVLEIYIGSAKDENAREDCHKSDCNNENHEEHYNLKVYKFIRANGGWDNWKFARIENYPCDNRTELRIREQYHYDLLKPALNTNRPYITEEEYKEYQSKWGAKHYQNNIEYYKIKSVKYFQENIEEMKVYKAKYRELNRDEKLKRNNQKFICDCGKEYTFCNKKRHCDSKRHKKFIEKNKLNTI